MPTVTFDVPDGALSALRLSPTEFVREMRMAAALLWYSKGEISQSKAAEIAGTSRAEFIDELAHRRIPVVQVTAAELQDEIHLRTTPSTIAAGIPLPETSATSTTQTPGATSTKS
jgi:predicted HTH domain antitoxin